jgi:carbonic anhydrase
MGSKKFATAINCIDGRVQLPVIDWLKTQFNVDYVDMITEPGPNKILADNKPSSLIESLQRRVEISVVKHRSLGIAVIGHYDCAGNPVEKDQQIHQIKTAVKTLQSWDFNLPVIGLWIDDQWVVQRII